MDILIESALFVPRPGLKIYLYVYSPLQASPGLASLFAAIAKIEDSSARWSFPASLAGHSCFQ